MGQVWRAVDEKLGREVALKVLPEEFALDPDRMARFEREAKVLASLNHPNIAHLYGLESAFPSETETGTETGTRRGPGAGGRGTGAGSLPPVIPSEAEGRVEGSRRGQSPPIDPLPRPALSERSEPKGPSTRGADAPLAHDDTSAATFLVMELVDGEDLSDVIGRGPVPVDEAIPIALQIAEALEAAHEQGIVHRDLKPANIKLRPDGAVKVLDFGLAKAWDAETGDHSLSLSPTLTAHATAAGVILGTAAYMAPEQAAGVAADRRADVWAFGVVLWEMLTGRKLFEGETVSHVLASVLKDRPDLEALPDGTPPQLRALVERCLRKKPRQRLQSIGDARLVLEEYLEDPEAALPALSGHDAVAPAPTPMRRKVGAALAAAAAVALGLLIGALLFRGSRDVPTIRFQVPPPEGRGFQLDSTRPGPVVISPDGRSLAFSAWDADGAVRIFIRELDEVVARPLSGTEDAQYPFWSPDAQFIGFFAAGKLKKVNASGGQPLTLCDAPDGKGGSWGPDGIILFAPGPYQPIHRVSQLGGESDPVTAFDDERGDDSHRHPRWLPDGKHFLYLARFPEGSREGQAVMAASLDGSENRLLVRSPAAAEYASGRLLYLMESTLMAQPFDSSSLELEGDPVPVADGVALMSTGTAQGVFSASRTGVLAFQSGTLSWDQLLRWRSRDGEGLESIGEPARFWDTVELSPTGTTAAVRIREDDGDNLDLWIVELDRRLRTRFTFDPAEDDDPVFSPDGNELMWATAAGDGSTLSWKAIGGSGEGEPVATFEKPTWPETWHPGRELVLINQRVQESPANLDIMASSISGSGDPNPWQSSEFIEYGSEFSPDGRWVVYGSNESDQWEVYVAPFPGPGRKWQVSVGGGAWPRWRGDGREIIYENLAGTLIGIGVEARGDGLAFSEPEELFQHKVSQGRSWDVTADGERFLLVEPEQDHDPQPITVVVNWPQTIDSQR
jgi:serine/threonine protein kinase